MSTPHHQPPGHHSHTWAQSLHPNGHCTHTAMHTHSMGVPTFLHPKTLVETWVHLLPLCHVLVGVPGCQHWSLVLVQVQAEIKRNWGKWQSSMESNVFNLATQEFTA